MPRLADASWAALAVDWATFEDADPDLAAVARRLLRRDGIDQGLLATVRGGGLPRIHPVYVGVIEGRLLTVALEASAKTRDLREDGRFALHAHQDPAVPHELVVRGVAAEVPPGPLRDAAAAAWPFELGDDPLFDLRLVQVTLGERPDADAWPPVYRSWRASAPG